MLNLSPIHQAFGLSRRALIRFHFAAGIYFKEDTDRLFLSCDIFDSISVSVELLNWKKILTKEPPSEIRRDEMHCCLEKKMNYTSAVAAWFSYLKAKTKHQFKKKEKL